MQPGSKLLIVETVIPPGNAFSIGKLLDLEVFVMGGGRERTEAEFRNLLKLDGLQRKIALLLLTDPTPRFNRLYAATGLILSKEDWFSWLSSQLF